MSQKTPTDVIIEIAKSYLDNDNPVDQLNGANAGLGELGEMLESMISANPDDAEGLTEQLTKLQQAQTLLTASAEATASGDMDALTRFSAEMQALGGGFEMERSDVPELAAFEEALDMAESADDPDLIAALDAAGDLNRAECRYGLTPLTLALHSEARSLALVEALLTRGARADFPAEGYTPLHALSDYTYIQDDPDLDAIAARLLEAGARLEARDDFGRTPLHRALNDGVLAEARALLKIGADPTAKINGETPSPCFPSGLSALDLAIADPEETALLLDHLPAAAHGQIDAALARIETELQNETKDSDYPAYYAALRQSREILNARASPS